MKWFLLLSLMFLALACAVHADEGEQDVNDRDDDDDGDMEGEAKEEEHPKPVKHHKWSYNLDDGETGTGMWNELFPDQCGSGMKRQSPINIQVDDAKHSEKLADIDILHPAANNTEKRMYLFNNGHAVKLDIEDAELYIVGGALGSEFKVAQLHFHWGSNDKQGSEHQINDKQFPLEMHVVTYNAERYTSLGEAVTGHNSLAVFGTLYRLAEKDNPNLSRIVDRLDEISEPGAEHKKQMPWFSIRSLMPPVTSKYFRYEGSLTTPTCDESVVWTVFAIPSWVSSKQMKEFRKLVEGTNEKGESVVLEDNWRPPQPLQNRKVQISFVPEDEYENIQERKEHYKEGESRDNGAPSLGVSIAMLCLILGHFIKH